MLVVVQNRHGKAHAAAQAIVDSASSYSIEASVASTQEIGPEEVVAADSLVVGCIAKTDTPFGGQEAHGLRSWMGALPQLDGKPVGVFCTFSFFPHTFADVTTRTAEVLSGLEAAIEAKGGTVVASQAILNRKMGEGVSSLLAPFLPSAEAGA